MNKGRFKSSLVDSESYVLTCYRYIEMNPVRAGMVGTPMEYPWSSVHANAYGDWDVLVSPHKVFERLDRDSQKRLLIYQALLDESICQEEIRSIRDHTNQGKVLGSTKFQKTDRGIDGSIRVL